MNEILATIKEVQEGGRTLANWYLQHGYVLLEIQWRAWISQYPQPKANGEMYYVSRSPVYVLGRPEGVEPAPLMPASPAITGTKKPVIFENVTKKVLEEMKRD